jgi:hypothetical protein
MSRHISFRAQGLPTTEEFDACVYLRVIELTDAGVDTMIIEIRPAIAAKLGQMLINEAAKAQQP